VFAGVYGFTQGIGGGVAEFFQQGGCGVKEQAPAGFAAAGGHALFGCCCFGFGFGTLGGHPQFESSSIRLSEPSWARMAAAKYRKWSMDSGVSVIQCSWSHGSAIH
jgi:hypothetical protein